MSKIFLFSLDLISKESFSNEEIDRIKSKILNLETDDDSLKEMICDVLQKTKDDKIEIYTEDTGISGNSGEEILSFIKKVESIVGGFIPGSSFEVGKDHPSKPEKWLRIEYSWEVEGEEEEDSESPWDEDTYWENEWDEWNEEWN